MSMPAEKPTLEKPIIQVGGRSEPRFRASRDAVSSPMGEELALLDFRTDTYFTLNDTGAAVWSQLAEPRSLDALCDHLSDIFAVEPEACRGDVAALLGELEAAGLIEIVEVADAARA